MRTTCQWCREIQSERAAIHEFDGGATRQQADQLASTERCPDHRPEPDLFASGHGAPGEPATAIGQGA